MAPDGKECQWSEHHHHRKRKSHSFLIVTYPTTAHSVHNKYRFMSNSGQGVFKWKWTYGACKGLWKSSTLLQVWMWMDALCFTKTFLLSTPMSSLKCHLYDQNSLKNNTQLLRHSYPQCMHTYPHSLKHTHARSHIQVQKRVSTPCFCITAVVCCCRCCCCCYRLKSLPAIASHNLWLHTTSLPQIEMLFFSIQFGWEKTLAFGKTTE